MASRSASWVRNATETALGLAQNLAQIGAVLALAALGFASQALAYDTQDYCHDSMRADRAACHAIHAAELADCSWSYAFDRWVGINVSDALDDANACRSEADAACRDCKSAVECSEVTP